ncbi:MAG: hypothetical protein ACYCS1_04255 [Gammaproteobacteria bacterium]
MYPLMPVLLNNTKWRHYRLRIKTDKDEQWIKVKSKIYKNYQLKKYLDLINPTDVYQSVSWWLNPQDLGARGKRIAGYPILNNFFLGTDYLMDFDLKDYTNRDELFSNINLARMELKNLGMNKEKLIKTGRGYQLLEEDFNRWANIHVIDPRDREKAYQAKMSALTDMLLKRRIKWDSDVSRDSRRVFRVINTKHFNGEIIKLIN